MKRKLITSAAFSSGAKFTSRIIGLASTLILARVLTPSDFAMIAIIAIVIHLFDILSHTGAEQYIVQKSHLVKDDLNTAWSLDLLLKSLVCLFLIFLAPLIANFFDKNNLISAMQVASITLVINALRNPGLLVLKRDLDYKKIFYLSLIQRIVSFFVVIVVAVNFRSYWAFVIADIVGAIVFTIASYKVQVFRPSFSLLKVSEQWLFSKWLLGKSIIGYLRAQVDTILVAKFFGNIQLGNYHMARDVAMLPGHNILGPAIEPLLADLKDYKNDPVKLGHRVSKVLSVVAFIVVPLTAYLAFYPKLIINVLLGDQWLIAGDLLGVMSLLFFYYCFLLVIESALTAIGKVKTIFWFDIFSLIVVVVTLLSYLQIYNVLSLAVWLRVSIGIISTLLITITLHNLVPLKLMQVGGALLLSASLSATSLFLSDWLTMKLELGHIMMFLVSGGVFCTLYAVIMVALLPKLMGTTAKSILAEFR
ncbi:oligosaccharide flippase family protein [Paraglaciecola sp. 2405UD69-4]|uniref:oligosaccharide flippase family protein n=1 Tax=Paraglaciecola sp. 2405UD69-4 TaxID=3391836 RepID=UPI0039C8E63F